MYTKLLILGAVLMTSIFSIPSLSAKETKSDHTLIADRGGGHHGGGGGGGHHGSWGGGGRHGDWGRGDWGRHGNWNRGWNRDWDDWGYRTYYPGYYSYPGYYYNDDAYDNYYYDNYYYYPQGSGFYLQFGL